MAQRGNWVTDGYEYPAAPSEEQTTARAAVLPSHPENKNYSRGRFDDCSQLLSS